MHCEPCTFYSKSKHEEKIIKFAINSQKVKEKEYYNVQKNSIVCIFLYKVKHLLYKVKNAWRFSFLVNHSEMQTGGGGGGG